MMNYQEIFLKVKWYTQNIVEYYINMHLKKIIAPFVPEIKLLSKTLFSYGNKSYSAKAHVTRQKLTEQKGYLRCIYVRKCSWGALILYLLALHIFTSARDSKYLRQACLSFPIYSLHLYVPARIRSKSTHTFSYNQNWLIYFQKLVYFAAFCANNYILIILTSFFICRSYN